MLEHGSKCILGALYATLLRALSVCPSIRPSIRPSIHPSVRPSVMVIELESEKTRISPLSTRPQLVLAVYLALFPSDLRYIQYRGDLLTFKTAAAIDSYAFS